MISDELIIKGFRSFDEDVTKEYFYGYCRKAYDIFDHKYQLRFKTGLDFYSLAHEYYITLMVHDFKQLLDRPKGIKLSSWMVNGFRFVVLDALKAYNKEFSNISDTADSVLDFIRSSDYEEGMLLQINEAAASHYKDDETMRSIARMVIYEGFTQKEVAEKLGMTPAAINQRYKKMMEEVVTPYVIENYAEGIYQGAMYELGCEEVPDMSFGFVAEKAGAMLGRIALLRPRRMMEITAKHTDMRTERITPDKITALKPNEVFVFGSNLRGIHAGGAARTAQMYFGAVMGQGVGLQGQSYAIPTMQGGVDTIKPYVDKFIKFAEEHPEKDFLVTRIGCGIAGFNANDIAPLFKEAMHLHNIWLPADFWQVLE